MSSIQIGNNNVIKNSVITSDSNVIVVGDEVTINGIKVSPCPRKGHNLTIINDKVYLNGYEFIKGRWRKTLKALWHKWF